MRNESFAADARSNRSQRPVEIVAPERDTPGARASACASTHEHRVARWKSSAWDARPARPSAHWRTSANTIMLIADQDRVTEVVLDGAR